MKNLKYILLLFISLVFAVVEESAAQNHFLPAILEVSIQAHDEFLNSSVERFFDT